MKDMDRTRNQDSILKFCKLLCQINLIVVYINLLYLRCLEYLFNKKLFILSCSLLF
jgi:hypothetical protein